MSRAAWLVVSITLLTGVGLPVLADDTDARDPGPLSFGVSCKPPSCVPIRVADIPLTITEPGDYCLVEDILYDGDAIVIETSAVSIDMKGLLLANPRFLPSDILATTAAVKATSELSNISIRNGRIAGHQRGINLPNVAFAHISNLHIDCNAYGNWAIRVGDDAHIAEVKAECEGSGIVVGHRSTVKRCNVSVIDFSAITAGAECTIVDNVVSSSRSYTVSVSGSSTIISNNRIYARKQEACLEVSGNNNRIEGNFCDDNGTGLIVSGNYNHIVANHIVTTGDSADDESDDLLPKHGYGLEVSGHGNLVVKNYVCDLFSAYLIGPGNEVGPIGGLGSSDSPWLNIVCQN